MKKISVLILLVVLLFSTMGFSYGKFGMILQTLGGTYFGGGIYAGKPNKFRFEGIMGFGDAYCLGDFAKGAGDISTVKLTNTSIWFMSWSLFFKFKYLFYHFKKNSLFAGINFAYLHGYTLPHYNSTGNTTVTYGPMTDTYPSAVSFGLSLGSDIYITKWLNGFIELTPYYGITYSIFDFTFAVGFKLF